MSETLFPMFARHQAEKRKQLASSRKRLIAALREIGVVSVEINYEGCGDQGQLVNIAASGSDDNPVNLECQIPPGHATNATTTSCSYAQALMDLAWGLLGVHHDGFDDNEGAYGTIAINVMADKITFDHYERYTDTKHTKAEV